MDWEELSSAPSLPTLSHAFPTFQRGPSSKSMPQAEVLDLKGGRGAVFGPLQSEAWKRGPGGVALPYRWGCDVGPGPWRSGAKDEVL